MAEKEPAKMEQRLWMLFENDMKLLELDSHQNPETALPTVDAAVIRDTAVPASSEPLSSSQDVPVRLDDANLASSYCPVMAMCRFPFKYIRESQSDLRQRVASKYFDNQQFWKRYWKLYYLKIPETINYGRLVLIRATDAQKFLDEINEDLNCAFTLAGKESLVLEFNGADGSPVPMELGVSNNYQEKEILFRAPLPLSIGRWDLWTCGRAQAVVDAYEKKVDAGIEAGRSKNKPSRNRRERSQLEVERQRQQTLLRAQSYFGLRAPSSVQGQSVANNPSPLIDAMSPAPFAFQDSPVFVSVDLEWNEHSPFQTTEVGISILDTLDLTNLSLGHDGVRWMHMIQSHHLRVTEYFHHYNHTFVTGFPDQFGFGESQPVIAAMVGRVVDQILMPPYGSFGDGIPAHKYVQRPLILVGHDLSGDIPRLVQAGSWVFRHLGEPGSVVRETWDTTWLYSILRGLNQQPSLETILNGFDIRILRIAPLHNAGNDARYVMEALIRIVLEAARKSSEVHETAVTEGAIQSTQGGICPSQKNEAPSIQAGIHSTHTAAHVTYEASHPTEGEVLPSQAEEAHPTHVEVHSTQVAIHPTEGEILPSQDKEAHSTREAIHLTAGDIRPSQKEEVHSILAAHSVLDAHSTKKETHSAQVEVHSTKEEIRPSQEEEVHSTEDSGMETPLLGL